MAVGTALLIISAAEAVYGAYKNKKAGDAAKDAAGAQADAAYSQAGIDDYNAKVADLQAKDAIETGAIQESQYRQGVRRLIGSQRAGFAGKNVDVNFGSAVDVQADTARLGELDALTIRTNALRAAWGYKVQATDLRAAADIMRKTGVYNLQAGEEQAKQYTLNTVGSFLDVGSSLLANRYGFKTNNNFGGTPSSSLYSGVPANPAGTLNG